MFIEKQQVIYSQHFSGIQRDKAMADKLMYTIHISNDDTQNYLLLQIKIIGRNARTLNLINQSKFTKALNEYVNVIIKFWGLVHLTALCSLSLWDFQMYSGSCSGQT